MLRDTDNELVSHFFGDAAVARDRRGLRPAQALRLHAAPVQWGGRAAQFAVEGLLWENSIVQSAV